MSQSKTYPACRLKVGQRVQIRVPYRYSRIRFDWSQGTVTRIVHSGDRRCFVVQFDNAEDREEIVATNRLYVI